MMTDSRAGSMCFFRAALTSAALSEAGIPVGASEDTAADQLGDDEDDDDESKASAHGNLLEAIESDDTVGLYLKEIGRVHLLTAPQEVDLAQRMERGKLAREHRATDQADTDASL